MKRTAIALAMLITGAASAAESDLSISTGGGLAYEALGLNLAARTGRLEGYLGIGVRFY